MWVEERLVKRMTMEEVCSEFSDRPTAAALGKEELTSRMAPA